MVPVSVSAIGAWLATLGVVLVSGCGTADVPPLGAEIEDGGRVVFLQTGCADDVSASLTETDDVVRIDDVSGDPVDGDCLGGLRLTLARPFGNRDLVVEGETWQRMDGDCPFGTFGPPDMDPRSVCQSAR